MLRREGVPLSKEKGVNCGEEEERVLGVISSSFPKTTGCLGAQVTGEMQQLFPEVKGLPEPLCLEGSVSAPRVFRSSAGWLAAWY